ncbi:MAG: hypothetical protein R6T99_05095 [Bacteroidales bacterium]
MNIKRSLIIILAMGFTASLCAQDFGKDFSKEDEKPAHIGRFFTGGGLDFWIGSREGIIAASPVIGYHISRDFDAGVRLTYSYYWYNDTYLKFHEHNYGGGVFARYYVFFLRDLFVHAEYEYLSYDAPTIYKDQSGNYYVEKERIPLHNIYVGGGYRQWISARAFVSLMVLFNLNETEYYSNNPILRIGFGVGL